MDNFYYKHQVYDPFILGLIFNNEVIDQELESAIEEREPIQIDYSDLSKKQQQVINLFLIGKNFTEIGLILDISKQAASKMYKRAVKMLKITNKDVYVRRTNF